MPQHIIKPVHGTFGVLERCAQTHEGGEWAGKTCHETLESDQHPDGPGSIHDP